MAELTRRLQILLTHEQFEFLRDLSEKKEKSIGDLIRIAVDRTYRPSSSLIHLRVLRNLHENSFLEYDSLSALPGVSEEGADQKIREGERGKEESR